MNAVTARLEGEKKKQSNKQTCKTSVSGAKRKDREGRRSEGLSKTEQQGDGGDGVELAERQREERAPVVGQQIAPHRGARLHGK